MDLGGLDPGELLGAGGDAGALLMLAWVLPVVLLVLYGQRIQLHVTSREIGRCVGRLAGYRDGSRAELAAYAAGWPGGEGDVGELLDYFTVMPVDMDPAGIVAKVRHFVRSREDATRARVAALCPGAGELELSRAQALLEIASTLQLLHKAVSHVYLTAKKQKNFPLILPLQMALPFIMEQAEALREAVPAFKAGQPVGDGIGPMVVGRMMLGREKREAAFQTVCCESELEGRALRLVKARGPLSAVGRPDEALRALLDEAPADAIVMVDAALKLEGEESATVARGFGAAIGGNGTERFAIEEEASRRGIPVYSVVVRQSAKEALGLMTREVAGAEGAAADAVRRAVAEGAREGRPVIVIGVGNTSGVLQ